jgi:hypothetical protein
MFDRPEQPCRAPSRPRSLAMLRFTGNDQRHVVLLERACG